MCRYIRTFDICECVRGKEELVEVCKEGVVHPSEELEDGAVHGGVVIVALDVALVVDVLEVPLFFVVLCVCVCVCVCVCWRGSSREGG